MKLRLSCFRAYLGSGLASAVLLGLCPVAHADEVRLLEVAALDWPDARRGLVAELSAAGFEVVPLASENEQPDALLEELARDDEHRFVASAAALREGDAGVAYVCLRGSSEVYRVTSSDADPALAAHVVALRVAELIALHRRQDTPAPPTPSAAPAPSVEREDQRSNWEVGLGTALRWSSGLADPLVDLSANVGFRIGAWLSLDARGSWSVASSGRDFADGTVEVDVRSLGLGVSAHLSEVLARPGSRRSPWVSSVSTRGILECFEIVAFENATATTSSTTACVPTLALSGRFGYRLAHWSFWLDAQGSFGLQAVRLVSEEAELATLGRPSATLGAGASWHF